MAEELLNSLQSEVLESDTMISRSQRRRIQRMLEKGVPKSRIADLEGVDRKTVYRIEAEGIDCQMPQTVRKKLLDEHAVRIQQWLSDDMTAAWIHRELTEKYRFQGCYETVKQFVSRIKPMKNIESTVRFETEPGDQAQMDWATFHYIDGEGKRKRIYLFCLILSYSRYLYAEFTTRCDTRTLIACHERAFKNIGGIPCEILYDRQSPVYQKQRSGEITLNPIFEQFARHWRFEPELCKPRRGQTKGKVERPIRYVRQDFYRAAKFTDVDDLNKQLECWLRTRANVRIHRTTGEQPITRLLEEAPKLMPCTISPFPGDWSKLRNINSESLVSYLANSYSVPHQYTGKKASVWDENGKVYIAVEGPLVATHDLFTGKGQASRNPAHYEGITHRIRNTAQGLKQEFLKRFPGTKTFVDKISEQRIGNVRYHLRQIIDLAEIYDDQLVLQAIEKATHDQSFHCSWVRKYCESSQASITTNIITLHVAGSATHQTGSVEQRDLSFYDRLCSAAGGR